MKYNKIVLIFPGQGSQYVGMGKELHARYKSARLAYTQAGDNLHFDIADICFRENWWNRVFGTTNLNKTVYTQPAVLTSNFACLKALEDRCEETGVKLNPFLTMGHSFGEYTALIASGAMDFETALGLVKKRAEYMSEAGKNIPNGGLMALLSKENELDAGYVQNLCQKYGVYTALINTQKQIVVGGSKKSMDRLSEELKKGGIITKALRVEGPFHTPLIRPAANRLKTDLDNADIYIASPPIIANVTAKAIADPIDIMQELHGQIYKPVDWKGSVENAIANGADLFIEIGPKTVLSNMIKEIDPEKTTLHVEDLKSLEEAVRELKS